MIRILLTGAGGQLGQAVQKSAGDSDIRLLSLDSAELDLKADDLEQKLAAYSFDVLINCAAYTAVDKAEAEPALADAINHKAVERLARACEKQGAVLIHLSTDYVYADKCPPTPLRETDPAGPVSVYGHTKYQGEQAAMQACTRTLIVRTSWLYGSTGHNFVRTMQKLGSEKHQVTVVFDQVGTPTNAADLAEALLQMARHSNTREFTAFGIYNYSNEGVCSWYDFAREIFRLSDLSAELKPVLSKAFPTAARRPAYSVLDKQKIKEVFNLSIPHWQHSLQKFLTSS